MQPEPKRSVVDMHPITEGQPRTQRPSLMDLLTGDLGSRAHINRTPSETPVSHSTASQLQPHSTQSNLGSTVKTMQSSQVTGVPSGTRIGGIILFLYFSCPKDLNYYNISNVVSMYGCINIDKNLIKSDLNIRIHWSIRIIIQARIPALFYSEIAIPSIVHFSIAGSISSAGSSTLRETSDTITGDTCVEQQPSSTTTGIPFLSMNPLKRIPNCRLRSMRLQASRIRFITCRTCSTKSADCYHSWIEPLSIDHCQQSLSVTTVALFFYYS